MIGTHAATGKRLEGNAHLAQSIADILTTPLGTRLMRHDYGSLLPELIDQPALLSGGEPSWNVRGPVGQVRSRHPELGVVEERVHAALSNLRSVVLAAAPPR